MPLSSLFARLGSLYPLEIIGDRIKGAKSRLGVGLSSGLSREPFKEIPGGILVPQNEDLERVAGKDYNLVIDFDELVLNRSGIFDAQPWPDPTNELECSLLKAATEGKWEVIQQAFHTPSQKEMVQEVRNKFDWTLLHFAAYHGHLDLVKKLVTVCKFPPDAQTKHQWTPVFLAAWSGHANVVKHLVKEQCSVAVMDVDGRSLLYASVRSGNFELVKWLVNEYNSPPTLTKDGGSLLIPAAQSGNLALFDWMVDRFKLSPHQWSENGVEHPLHSAAQYGHFELTKHLIHKYKCDVYCKGKYEWTLLHSAALGGSVSLIEWLMANHKFEIKAKTKDGLPPLMLAAVGGHLPVARLLVETYHCNVNEDDGDSVTPVMYAAQYDHLPVLKMLVEHGGDVFHKTQGSSTALHWAAYVGSIECVEYLLPLFGERMFDANENGATCLHYAVWGGSLPVMRYLVDQCGFDLSLSTADGRTPLMLAAGAGHLPVARLLVETYHCNVNEESGESATPVMYAAVKNHLPVLKMLVEHGGDVFHKGPDSSTALHQAAIGGSLECVEYLLPLFGERMFEMDEDGWTCLHYAVWGVSLPVTRYLVDQCGFDLSLRTANGRDCFLLACEMGREEIVRELLTKDKVDRNVVDNDGRGAVHLACKGGHMQLVKTLVEVFGMSPDVRDNAGRTPIQLAPDSAHADLLKALHLEEDSSAPPSHESVLEDVCWIPSGIESLFITPFGGVFPLQPEGGEEEGDEDMIQLHVPQGAVRADGEGVLEVHYAVIPDGPFRTPEGYKLCSMAVYLYYDPAQTTKPFYLLLPHWSGAPGHPTFVTSPHTLPEGEPCYPFRLLEGGEFGETYGLLEVDGHSTLFGAAYCLKDTSRYLASQWEREEGNILYSKVAITFDSNVWIRILKNHWSEWKKRLAVASFQMKEDHIESSLTEASGRGWSASVVGMNRVGPEDLEYKKRYDRDETELQFAVEEHMYPPAISLQIVLTEVPKHMRSHKRILLSVHGAMGGAMHFPVDFFEEKQAPSVVVTRAPSEESSSEVSVSPTRQAPATGGEREVVQSMSEVALTDRDPVLSQPVHSCERYAVLFRKYVSRRAAGRGKAILEFLGLDTEMIDLCYQDNPRNEEEAVQDGLKKWRAKQSDRCTWQVLLDAMQFAGIAQQHCTELVEELHQMMQGNK